MRKCVGVKGTHLHIRPPLTCSEISEWENKQGVLLPEDLRSFYLSSNGYLFEWTYAYTEESSQETAVGKIVINSLDHVEPVYGYETTGDEGVTYDGNRYIIRLAPESKLFELALLPERGKVVLVYLHPQYVPTIWLITATSSLYYLADDIAAYLRMAIFHLGVPNWQLAYTPEGLPVWTENLFRLIAPNLLPLGQLPERMRQQRKHGNLKDFAVPVNKLDPKVFQSRSSSAVLSQPQPQNLVPEPQKNKLPQKTALQPAIQPRRLFTNGTPKSAKTTSRLL